MALRLIFLASVFFAGTFATVTQLDLTGFVQDGARAALPCPPGQECPPPPPLRSATNASIWHCDGTCTKVFLWCHPDRFQLAVELPIGAKEIVVSALGGHGHIGGPYKIRECDSALYGPGSGRSDLEQGRWQYAGVLHEQISYDRCGTAIKEKEEGQRVRINYEYHNALDLVEYLPALTATQFNAAIHLISHTHINIQCCSGGGSSNGTCPPIAPSPVDLWECTNKTFTLSCSSDDEAERYCCQVELAAGESLPAGVGYYLEKCEATDINGNHPQGSVSLFNNGSPNSNLQVEVGSSSSQSQYSIGGPWFQFDRPASDLSTHAVGVDCTVKLVASAQLANHRPSGKFCSAGARPRSDAGFFQAGDLTLIKDL